MAAERATSPSRPVALCGFMGVGKSGIGRIVARSLHRQFFDSDAVVVARLGRDIPDLFSSGEEALFRSEEAAVIADLVTVTPPAVISLGGGALENPQTRQLVVEQALLVHIYQPWEELRPALERLGGTRPLLAGQSEDDVHELYLARQASYRMAELTVTTARHGVPSAARDVLAALARRQGKSET